jgi:hypothetical protein
MRRLAVACVVLAACSHIFGLDGVPADDRDGDHWPDAIDNCPNDYNPDQSDVDGNGVGDRCQLCESPSGLDDDSDGIPNECDGCDNRLPDNNHDGVPDACEHLNDAGMIVIPTPDASCPLCAPCALGPPHDEDHDDTADACDDCPIFPSLVETGDSDGDGVGDACDVSPSPSHQLFDAFAAPNQDWFEVGTWTVSGDKLHIIPSIKTAFRQLGTGASHFAIRTRLTDQGNPIGAADVGVIATRGANITSTTFDEQLECRVRSALGSTNGSELVLDQTLKTNPVISSQRPLAMTPPYRVQLEYDAKLSQITCTASGTDGNAVQIPLPETDPSPAAWATGLVARPGGGSADFEYYELVTDD